MPADCIIKRRRKYNKINYATRYSEAEGQFIPERQYLIKFQLTLVISGIFP
jgi:hypothetical protein